MDDLDKELEARNIIGLNKLLNFTAKKALLLQHE